MEQVAGRAESLAKEKVKDTASTKKSESIYTKVYSSDGKAARDKRAKQRELHQTALDKLGEKEYKKLLQEVDLMTDTSVDINKLIDKRVNEIQERMESERQEEEASQRRVTRSQASTSTETTAETEPVPQVRSPRKRGKQEEHKETGGKKPKKTTEQKDTAEETAKPDERKETGGKRPKASEWKETAGKTPKTSEHKTTGGKKPKTPKVPQHIDGEDYELDLDTGKFIRKKKADDANDESTSRKGKGTDKELKTSDTVDKSKDRGKKNKKTGAIPLLEDDDDDDQDDLMVVDDEDRDVDYEPEDEDEQMDDEDFPAFDDDDDDFQEPPPRARKDTKKEQKQTKKKSTQQRVEVSDGDALSEETLSLFQKIVGDNFEVRASEEFEDESSEKKDRCINPVEAAGFRATMKTLALEVKKAVRKGKDIKETYTDMIRSTIRIAKAMKYPGAGSVQTEDILESIKDIECHAWRKYLQGKTTMQPEDMVVDDQGEAPPSSEDLLIKQNMLGKESTDAAAAAIEKLPKLLKNDIHKKLRNLFDSIEQAHRHAAEATKTLRELHDDLPLDVFLRIADATVRPLVILHIPRTEALVNQLKEAGMEQMQRIMSGSHNVVDVMVQRNLPSCGTWTTEDEYKPRKMVAAIIHKYIRDVMLKEPTATKVIVDEFKIPKTTIHRQIWGKKYTGGGQKLENVREGKSKAKASSSGSGVKKVAAVIIKRSVETDKLAEKHVDVEKGKKGKGTGKSSSSKSRSAADIREQSTAKEQKQKRLEKALEEAEVEDPDLPTKAEIAASKPARRGILIHT